MTPPFSRTIRAVTFDAADTLLHVQPSVGEVYQEILAKHDLSFSAETLQSGFRRAFKSISKNPEIIDGEEREFDFWKRIVLNTIGGESIYPPQFEAAFADLWNAFSKGRRWKIADGAEETLATLRSHGYQLALLTNWDKRVRPVLADLALYQRFDHIFISSEIGYDKPDVRIFQFSADRLNLAPDQIAHVGDNSVDDIRGAIEAGWHALHLRRNAATPQPAIPIQDLREILYMLPDLQSP